MQMTGSHFIGAMLVALLPAALLAQAASSKTYFLSGHEAAPGATMQTGKYALTASIGDGAVGPGSDSANYNLAAGFTGGLEAKVGGSPWLTAVAPRFATPRGGALLTLSGAALDLGGNVKVDVNGRAAVVQTTGPDTVTVKLPLQPEPGWQPVQLTNGSGTSTLAQGLGILPMVFTDPAAAANVPFQVVFKGSPGDQVVWAAGIAPSAPLALPGLHYGLALHPAVMLVLPGFRILDPSGEFRFAVPATGYVGSIYLQAVFATSNPGYAPGSFSNVLRL